MHTNVEIKARCGDPKRIRRILAENGADFRGKDHQTDTYFDVPNGRLKLREGNIENKLIFYDRPERQGMKESRVILFGNPDRDLKEMLTRAVGVKIIVDKEREIYFIGNVKFHIDSVEKLGSFVEIEAMSENAALAKDELRKQCEHYLSLFGIQESECIDKSYADMMGE